MQVPEVEGHELCFVMHPDLPVQITVDLLHEFFMFEVELEDGVKYSSLLPNDKYGPDAGIGRSSDDLFMSATPENIVEGLDDAYIEEPLAGFVLPDTLEVGALEVFQSIFKVDPIELDGHPRHLLRTVWQDMRWLTEPPEEEDNGTL